MHLDTYKGNEKTVDTLNEWLNSYFHGFQASDEWLTLWKKDLLNSSSQLRPYVILHGTSGNGKTFLVEGLSKYYKVDLLRFTMDDFSDSVGIKLIEKSLNLQSIESVNVSKIVLIDDIQDLKDKKYSHLLKKIYTLYEVSNYPVIFITDDKDGLDREFVDNGLVLEIKKPVTSVIVKLLEEKSKELNINCSCIEEIADKSYSVRTALQGLLMGRPIIKNSPLNSISSNLKLILQRSLQEDLTYPTLVAMFRGIRSYDKKSFQLREELCQLDELWHVEFFKDKKRTLDPIFVNQMKDTELIKIEYKERERKVKESKKKEEKPKVEEEKVEVKESNVSSLDAFW